MLLTEKQRLCRLWGDFTQYSLPQKEALKTNTNLTFCRAIFYYGLEMHVMSPHPIPPNSACFYVPVSQLLFSYNHKAKQLNHAPIKLHVSETEPGKGNFLTVIEETLERSIDITWS